MQDILDFRIHNKEGKWAFPATSTKILEKKLLGQSQMDSLLSTEARDAFLSILGETHYSSYVEGETVNIDFLYWEEISMLFKAVSGMLPKGEDALKLLFLKVDLGFLKTAYKLARNEKDPLPEEFHFFLLPREALKQGFSGKIFKGIEGLSEILNQAMKAELNSIDNLLDDYFFEQFLSLADKYRSDLLYSLFEKEVDFINIKMVLRNKLYEEQGLPGRRNLFFRSGGMLDTGFLNRCLDESIDVFLYGLPVEYRDTVIKAWEEYQEKGSFLSLDVAFYNLSVDLLKNTKYYLLRADNVITYIFARLRELNLLRRAYILANNEITGHRDRELTYAA